MIRLLVCSILLLVACASGQTDPRLAGASRSEQDGWVVLHLRGTPSQIGFQHGYLASAEIDDALRMFSPFLRGLTDKDWLFYRAKAKELFWPKVPREYQEEIQGIVDGLAARGLRYDVYDITAMNGWMELAWYYVPWLANQAKADSMNNRAPGNCSAMIATGSYTKDGRIVMAHNSWIDYPAGERWNLALDIIPASGQRMMMDAFPGCIQSGDDFAINGAGILISETTITGFKNFRWSGMPEFVRARRAQQYATSIDSFVRIISEDNNGAYANTWLVGDLRTNEIAKLDLGLKHQHLWRSKDTVFVGSNFGTDEALLREETTFNTSDPNNSPNARRTRWAQVVREKKGGFDLATAEEAMGDHVDAYAGKVATNRCALCGHAEDDPIGIPEWSNPPYYPTGAVNGKVTTAALAAEFSFWGRMGHPCGTPFIAKTFIAKHPEYRWMESFLVDMPAHPWTKLSATMTPDDR
jgi:hypothetical protein